MTAMSADAPMLGSDVPCVRCGYNLRSLSREDHCPECGLGVARSMTLGRQLHESRPRWISLLAWAAILLLICQVMLLLAMLVGIGVIGAILPNGLYISQWEIAVPMLAGIAALHLVAVWLLTRRENPHGQHEPLRKPAVLARICSILVFLGLVIMAAGQVSSAPMGARIMIGELQIVGMILTAAIIPCPLLEFMLLHRLAQRVLDEGLAEHSAIVGTGYSISLLACFVVPFILRPRNPSAAGMFIVVLMLPTAVLLFWLWSIVLYCYFAYEFRKAARKAREKWLSSDASIA